MAYGGLFLTNITSRFMTGAALVIGCGWKALFFSAQKLSFHGKITVGDEMKQLDPRQIKSIEKLQDAYLSLLLKGADQFSIQQLCTEAQVTRPTFYKSFKDIFDLRNHIHQKIFLQLKNALTIKNPRSLDEMPREDMNYNLLLLFDEIIEHHLVYEIFLVYQPDAQFTKGLKEILTKYVQDGIYYSRSQDRLIDVHINLLIAYVAGAYLESIIWWIKENYQESPQKMANILIELALHGPYKKDI